MAKWPELKEDISKKGIAAEESSAPTHIGRTIFPYATVRPFCSESHGDEDRVQISFLLFNRFQSKLCNYTHMHKLISWENDCSSKVYSAEVQFGHPFSAIFSVHSLAYSTGRNALYQVVSKIRKRDVHTRNQSSARRVS